jgi:dTDP-4-amino-4,6-dideoxygalactose transaminase
MNIRLGDIRLSDEQRSYITDIMDTGRITEGKYTRLFEEEVAKFLGVKNVIAVTNGTVALQLVAQYIKYRVPAPNEGHMVCVPSTTFPATLNAFENVGLYTTLCDIDESLCINIDNIPEVMKRQITTIVPVSLLGYCPDMDKIMKEAKNNNWIVVEDFAEAFGSEYKGRKLGSIGDFGCSSFYVSHVIQGGELGIVTTNNDDAAKIMRSMKNHGRTGSNLEFRHSYIGSNYKTTEFCAAIAYSHMKQANEIIKKRWENAKYLSENIKNKKLSPMPVYEGVSFLGYPILAANEKYRDLVCKKLNDAGIETRGMFPCLSNQKAYWMFGGIDYPVSDEMEKRGFYIGVHQYLTKEELDFMVTTLNEVEE